MIKQQKYGFKGLAQDISEDKQPLDLYYDANNIRIGTTLSQTEGSVINEKGNELVLTISNPIVDSATKTITAGNQVISYKNTELDSLGTSGNQVIISKVLTKDGFVLFSTDNNGFDCIWEIIDIFENYSLSLIYCGNLSFSTSYPIQAIFNYENDKLQKIYWADGINQLRFLNLKHSIANGDLEDLIDLKFESVNIVGKYDLSQPKLTGLTGGGNNTASMVQYAYNLYKLNGAQTTISPFSEMVPLDNGLTLGGGSVNEVVGMSPQMTISTLDTNYTHLRVYAIRYTSYNQTPTINLIIDEEINSYSNYKFLDDGNNISSLALAEFLFLGSDPLIPKHIASKDNRLLAANYQDSAYDIDIDMRAYSHDSSGATKLYSGNVSYTNGQLLGNNRIFFGNTAIVNYNYDPTHDAINPDYDVYKYQKNGTIIGGEGLYVRYKILQKAASQLSKDLKYLRFFKDNEIYRIGIEFYNKLGQKTDVKWIADFKAPEGNMQGLYNTLVVELKLAEFNAYINSLNLDEEDKPVGYRILRAERNSNDMSILCQGSLTGMMFQGTNDASNYQYWDNNANIPAEAKKNVKIPIPITRGFVSKGEGIINPTANLSRMSGSGNYVEGFQEIYSDIDEDFKNQHSFQYTKMMQLHSPDILFNTGLVFGGGLELKVRGIARLTRTDKEFRKYWVDSKTENITQKVENNPSLVFTLKEATSSVISPIYQGGRANLTEYRQYSRVYSTFEPTSQDITKDIYQIPEIAERGQGATSYAGDSEFRYVNTMTGVITDTRKRGGEDDPALVRVNSFGEKCGVLVLGGPSVQEENRPTLESLKPTDTNSDGLLIAEIKRPKSYIYNGGVYGGLLLEDKNRTDYVQIGDYQLITTATTEIESPGDIYVQTFRFARLSKTDTEVYDNTTMQLTEIVEHRVETTVNLKNRSDLSLLGWDNKFQPQYTEFHEYNRVYSQQANLVKSTEDSFKFKKVNQFGARIISSKVKVPGETIDSWTDFLENETIDLDGKYGSINHIINMNDEIYSLQDFAVAKIGVNPRVQTQGDDGVSIQLGTGNVLHDYQYLTTNSGCINKWSVGQTSKGFSYVDLINKGLFQVGNGLREISLIARMDSFFKNNLDYNVLKDDNPVLGRGISTGYDNLHKTLMLTVLQPGNNYTISYNEKREVFESFYSFTPSLYISRGTKLLTPNPDKNKIYEHFKGDYNKFYDTLYPSNITLQVHTQSNDSIFNNIMYKSQLKLNGLDVHNKTLTHIKAYNEYQSTALTPLVVNSNISRRFRRWKANIPMAQVNGGNSLDRIRGQWVKIFLELQNPDNHQLVLHDMNIAYTVYPN